MRMIKTLFLITIVIIGVQACSFRSTQLDLLMSIFEDEQEAVPVEELFWTLIWSGNNYSLLPVIPTTGGNLTTFVNVEGTITVLFDGFQIIEVTGLLPGDLNIDILKTDTGLEYSTDEELIIFNTCEEFNSSLVGETTVWLQNCDSAEGPYTNEIRVNAAGSITLLQFLAHPEYPMLTLTPNNLIF